MSLMASIFGFGGDCDLSRMSTEDRKRLQRQIEEQNAMFKTTPSVALNFPIRAGFLAQVVVPKNMTVAEAKRLCSFVESLASPDSGEEPR